MSEGVLKIPWQELAIDAGDAAKLFALSKDRFLRTVAARPTFPQRVNTKPAAWKVGEVLEWRDRNRATRRSYAKGPG